MKMKKNKKPEEKKFSKDEKSPTLSKFINQPNKQGPSLGHAYFLTNSHYESILGK